MSEGRDDFERAFRELSRAIFASVEAALEGAPEGYMWTTERSIFKVTKIDDDAYSVELGGDVKVANRREAAAFILLLLAQGLGGDSDG